MTSDQIEEMTRKCLARWTPEGEKRIEYISMSFVYALREELNGWTQHKIPDYLWGRR